MRKKKSSRSKKKKAKKNPVSHSVDSNNLQEKKSARGLQIAGSFWRRVPLEGEELASFLAQRRAEEDEKREFERQEAEKKRARDLAKIHDYEGEDVDSAQSLYNLWTNTFDFHVPSLEKVLTKNKIHPMFPYFEYRTIQDDYGEVREFFFLVFFGFFFFFFWFRGKTEALFFFFFCRLFEQRITRIWQITWMPRRLGRLLVKAR